MEIEIGMEMEDFRELKEAWAGLSEEERSALISKALVKTAQDIKTEEDKTTTSYEL